MSNPKPSLLRQARDESGMTVEEICQRVACKKPTLYRVEKGEVTPKRPLARALFALYRGTVPLSHIYDPEWAGKVAEAS